MKVIIFELLFTKPLKGAIDCSPRRKPWELMMIHARILA
jgi:hypothetical protein